MSIANLVKRRLRKLRLGEITESVIARQVSDAYLGILARRPDAEGLASYVRNVRSGRQTMGEVCQELFDSAERRTFLARARERQSAIIGELYRVLLRRNVDDAGNRARLERLEDEELNIVDIVKELVTSEEFAIRFSTHPNVAARLVETLMVRLTGRHPGAAAIAPYVDAMSAGYPLGDFIDELRRSPEFVGGGERAANESHRVPVELAVLAQDLMAEHMQREGSIVALPPMEMTAEKFVSASELASLIRTLAMLGDVQDRQPASAANATPQPAREPAR